MLGPSLATNERCNQMILWEFGHRGNDGNEKADELDRAVKTKVFGKLLTGHCLGKQLHFISDNNAIWLGCDWQDETLEHFLCECLLMGQLKLT